MADINRKACKDLSYRKKTINKLKLRTGCLPLDILCVCLDMNYSYLLTDLVTLN